MMRRFASASRCVPLFTAAATSYRSTQTTATNFSAGAGAVAPKSTTPAAALTDRKLSAYDFPNDVLKGRVWESHQAGRHITVYVDSGFVAWIVMDRDGSSANALGDEFVENLSESMDIVEKLVGRTKVQYAILASAKSAFCVGADIDQMYPITDAAVAAKVPAIGHKLFTRIENSSFPVIAAINGFALGGGFELSLACHSRAIASDAKVGFPECLLGLLPGGGGTVRTQRLCGLTKTVQWIMTSQQVKAQAAKKAGAVDVVLPGEDRYPRECRFYHEVRRWAGQRFSDRPPRPATRKTVTLTDRLLEGTSFGRRMVADKAIKTLNKRTRGKYIAQYKALECIMYSATRTNQEGFDKECTAFGELLTSPEAKNQMSLYFLDEGMKKSEKKTGIPKAQVPEVKKVGVIGAGVMGSGIVHYFANKSIPVAVTDLKQEFVEKGIRRVHDEFQLAVKRKRMDEATLKRKMSIVSGGTIHEAFKDVDVIVEAAVEVMETKKQVIQQLERDGLIHGGNLFATNTSSLSLTEMQEVSKYPENIVGMHFFNPVSRMPLVEVVKGKKTSAKAAAVIFNLALGTGKKPIIVNDGPGFLVNRILGVYMAEAGRLAMVDGCHPAKIDAAILDFGMPMGPFRLLDEVGLDVAVHVGPVLHNGLKSDRFAVGEGINRMVADGILGKKNGKGFYKYDESGKEGGLNTESIAKYIGPSLNGVLSDADIVDRCVLLMVNEASLILAEGIANSPEDVDIGMIWGTGFPAFRGGLLQYADHRGIENIVDNLNRLALSTKSERFKPSQMLVDMANDNKRFFPNRPWVPYVERSGFPKVHY